MSSVPDAFPRPPARARREHLRERLTAWFRAHRRDLPWRHTRDPYAIWISEAMLQQTRVETVRGYWTRFLERFPTLERLAAATDDEVLAAWSGLGYYRRARALKAAAALIVERHAGQFPGTRDELLALPGIGPYTAGAVLSIAFDQGEPLVDGNVERVFARLFGLDAPAGSSGLARHCWRLADLLVPEDGGAGEWNQALMELGATVCVPREPKCGTCPLARSCQARRAGQETDLPRPKPRRDVAEVELEILVVEDGGRVLLERRADGGRMAGLLEFPTVERPGPGGGRQGLFPESWPAGRDGRALLASGDPIASIRHGITHHRIHAVVRAGVALAEPSTPPFDWVPGAALTQLALTGMARKVLRKVPRLSRETEAVE